MTKAVSNNKHSNDFANSFRNQALGWYDVNKRDLPWRDVGDPYKTWLSEIMLQQTTVAAVKSYYIKFLEKWPAVHDLAAATQEEVLHEWAGLGYYSRARNLHKCAQMIVRDFDGEFPSDQKQLLSLPGVGDYSSAAIRTIAFNKPATVVDGNIERIMSRIFAIKDPLPKSKPILKERAALFFDAMDDRAGDFAQALMDIGSGVCTARSPKCERCPVQNHCAATTLENTADYPFKIKKKKRPYKKAYAYIITNEKGEILLERRPDKGLLAGMLGFPCSPWEEGAPQHLSNLRDIGKTDLKISHSFTHFDLDLCIARAKIAADQTNGLWVRVGDEEFKGLPTVFAKVYKHIRSLL